MKKYVISIVVIFLLIIGFCSVSYTTRPDQYAAIKKFGKIVRVVDEPGLHFKKPIIESVQKISKAMRLYDVPESDVITRDKKSMTTNNYVLWKVDDPVKFIQTLSAVDARAEERVDAAVYNATKNVISSLYQNEIIEYRGEKLSSKITEEANSDIGSYGIEIVITQIKVLDLPEANKNAVLERMISERDNVAAKYEAEGKAEAQKIRNEFEKQVTVMTAEAEKEAEVLKAEGEAEYMAILAEAYNDPDKAEFYNYKRSLEALKKSLKGQNKTIILDKDSEIAKILYGE